MSVLPGSRLHRQAVVLAGSQSWCRQQAASIAARFADLTVCRLADTGYPGLGQEVDVLIVDAWAGLDPDRFGRAAGTIRGGGLLVLLVPELDQWPDYADPQNARVNVALYSPASVKGRFIQHLVNVLRRHADVRIVEAGQALPDIHLAVERPRPAQTTTGRTPDQQRAIDAVIKVVTGQRRRPVVLTSDRGRGKSAAFGFAAAELLKQGVKRITVTGPSIQSVEAVFKHAAEQLAAARRQRGLIETPSASIRFSPPDELIVGHHDTDLLLVDEAAAIPSPVLQKLLAGYPRIAFATTVHGYEGTGRGFAVRFTRVLDAQTRGWKNLRLETPIRWAADDPLEALVSDMLLLAAEAAPDAAIEGAMPDNCRIERVDRDAQVSDQASLSELFGLLILAHYRTRPFDLRHLLDGPNISVYVMRHRSHVVATALVAKEGGFDAESARSIRRGESRPHGHLLSESLAAHLGLERAAQLACARVMRIAVHPAVQERGLGSALVAHMTGLAGASGLDYIGSSFAATTDVVRFWRALGFTPVRLSIRRGATSGEHSAVLIRGLSPAGSELVRAARRRFETQLYHQLAGPLRRVDPALIALLLPDKDSAAALRLDPDDKIDLEDFAHARRLYDTCLGPVRELTWHMLRTPAVVEQLNNREAGLLIARVLQFRDWAEVAPMAGVKGRKPALSMLRHTIAKLLEFAE